jgi:hypothetical protein
MQMRRKLALVGAWPESAYMTAMQIFGLKSSISRGDGAKISASDFEPNHGIYGNMPSLPPEFHFNE